MQTAGLIFDLYDDSNGLVLRNKIGDGELPEKLASMDLMTKEALDRLPNRLFAVVAQNGEDTLRKYAMHDEAHLVTSLVYFMERKHLWPDEVQKVAAHNLCVGCGWYGVEPPEEVVKLAVLGKVLAAADVASRAVEGSNAKKQEMDAFRQAQSTGIPVGTKTADLNGTEMMPNSAVRKDGTPSTIANTAKRTATRSKTAAGRLLEELDLGDSWIGPLNLTSVPNPNRTKEAQVENYALPSHQAYPIDGVEQVKTAQAYFEENWGGFDLGDRHVFATNLQDRADQIGLGDLGGMVREYAGRDYGTKIAGELQSRIHNFEGMENQAVYEALLEKVASTPSEVMAQVLMEADQATGVDRAWNQPFNGFLDPYRAVFSKTADDVDPDNGKQWSWSLGSTYINDTMVRDFVVNENRAGLRNAFGDEFANDFVKDPIAMFESLPDPQKHAVARMISDNSNGSYRKA